MHRESNEQDSSGLRLRAVLIGHSHAAAIRESAIVDPEIDLTFPDLWALWPDCGYDPESDRLDSGIARQVSDGTVISALGGSAHARLGLVQHSDPFDFVLPQAAHLPLAEGARIIPFGAVRDTAIAELSRFHRYMLRVRATACGRMYHIAQPPVLKDDAQVLADVPWDQTLAPFPVAGKAVSPASLRWKLWRLTSDITQRLCEENDIHYIDCPAESFDEEGYLRREYYERAFHGNAAYGALVLAQIRKVLSSAAPSR